MTVARQLSSVNTKMKCEGSLLHPKIAKFYKLNENQGGKECAIAYVDDDCTYNWTQLEELFETGVNSLAENSLYPNKYDEWFAYFQLVTPVLRQSDNVLAKASLTDEWWGRLQWLAHQVQMQTVVEQHFNPTSETSNVENVLFLTSILENGLGNLYHTLTDRLPPHLLRDLLDTRELKDFLGTCPVFFLKILMGSPNSVNLRNVVWHGFPLPSEIPRCYTSTLLIVASSVFRIIDEKNLVVKPRPQVTDFSRFALKIKPSLDFSLLLDVSRIECSIETSKWTSGSDHKAFWKQAVKHYQKGCYWQFVILILPQIELILRRMYGEANDFDITAKLDEYYITMNSVFESHDNLLLSGILSRGTLHCLYDIFISPFGMRIRDKISHGEVDLNCIDKDLGSILLYVGLNLIASNREYPLGHYESRFHQNTLAYDSIAAAKENVLDLMALQAPQSFQCELKWDQDSIGSLRRLQLIKPLEIFNRYKKESEVMAILMRISQLIIQVCENYKEFFAEKFQQYLSHTLRSRARKTLQKMIESMPIVGTTLASMVQCLGFLNNSLHTKCGDWLENSFLGVLKFCKQTLTIVENIVRFSDKESNEWLNVLDYCKRFQEASDRFVSKLGS